MVVKARWRRWRQVGTQQRNKCDCRCHQTSAAFICGPNAGRSLGRVGLRSTDSAHLRPLLLALGVGQWLRPKRLPPIRSPLETVTSLNAIYYQLLTLININLNILLILNYLSIKQSVIMQIESDNKERDWRRDY